VWAIVDRLNLTDGKPTPVANATGRFAQIRLQPGSYQAGLLVVDSSGGNAIAQKNFQVGPAPPLAPGEIPINPDVVPSPSPSPSAGADQPPVIPPLVAPLDGETGGRVTLPSIEDPNGGQVDVKWDLKEGDSVVRSGAGSVVSLANVEPGSYTILVTATDGRLTSTGSYSLRVRRGTGPAPPPPSPPPPPPPSLDLALRLPSLMLSQGAVVEIDAGSTGVPFRNLTAFQYRWALKSRATGQTLTTREGQHVSLPLDEAESLQLLLTVTDPRLKASTNGTSNLRVIPLPEGSDPLPRMEGTCPPFKVNPSSDTTLSCSGLRAVSSSGAAVPEADLTWAWRLTRVDTQKITLVNGTTRAEKVGRLPEANYIVEAAVGYKGPPTSQNTIYFLSSYLVSSPNNPPSPGGGSAPKPPSPAPKPPAG
jgi:hypothetical protein